MWFEDEFPMPDDERDENLKADEDNLQRLEDEAMENNKFS